MKKPQPETGRFSILHLTGGVGSDEWSCRVRQAHPSRRQIPGSVVGDLNGHKTGGPTRSHLNTLAGEIDGVLDQISQPVERTWAAFSDGSYREGPSVPVPGAES